jgi:hypothetical protein
VAVDEPPGVAEVRTIELRRLRASMTVERDVHDVADGLVASHAGRYLCALLRLKRRIAPTFVHHRQGRPDLLLQSSPAHGSGGTRKFLVAPAGRDEIPHLMPSSSPSSNIYLTRSGVSHSARAASSSV